MEMPTTTGVRVAKKKPAKDETVNLQVTCKRKFHTWIHELAKADDRSVSAVVRRALVDYGSKIGFSKPPED